MTNHYKGIVIFGAPGSGKTTIAKLLLSAFPQAKYLEAFNSVIAPAIVIKKTLPKNETDFIKKIKQIYTQPINKNILREEARDFFTYLKNHYTSSVIAKTLIYIHQQKFKQKLLLVAGIRGYKNSTYFKQNGYLVVYLKTPDKHLISRVSKRENFSLAQAEKEQQIEERLFSTNKVEKIAHLSFNTAATKQKEIVAQIKSLLEIIECKKCVNNSLNPTITINPKTGLCELCELYEKYFDKTILKKELKFLLSLKNSNNKYDCLVGISGGKDSTATLAETLRLGFKPLAFTFDTGYYPKHIFKRAKKVAKSLAVDYEYINVQKYIRPVDYKSFQKTADLYSQHDSFELKEKFRKWYLEGRRHYSIKCQHEIPFVRTCQLCRRIIVRAYYGQAIKNKVNIVILGINEWAGLSQNSQSKKFIFSGIRKLQPFKNKPPVYIVHLPFLLQHKIKDTQIILKKLGWKIPSGERIIESNSNSCLFAKAAENKAKRMLGFHPDTTRLAREVTVGFISKQQAQKALNKIHRSRLSVKDILRYAKLLK